MWLFYLFLIIGIVLLIAELHTGTVYLLAVAVSSISAAVVSLFIANIFIPIITATLLAIIGCACVYKYLPKPKSSDMAVQHVGQIAEVIEVTHQKITVLYSGSYWQAQLKHPDQIEVGAKVKIVKYNNSLLIVEKV